MKLIKLFPGDIISNIHLKSKIKYGIILSNATKENFGDGPEYVYKIYWLSKGHYSDYCVNKYSNKYTQLISRKRKHYEEKA
jgi:hypothetical protein